MALIHRTTRQCTPSEAGLRFYEGIKPALEQLGRAKSELTDRRLQPSGVLRVGASVLFGPDFLVPLIAEYMRTYPKVEVDLQLSDTFSDLASSGLDMVVRIADLPDSGLRGRRLGALRRVVFGAPSYFAQHGRPAHPTELRRHRCIVRTVDQRPGQWVFQVGGKPQTVTVHGTFRTNTMTSIYHAVCSGLGLGYSPLWPIRHLVDSGRVQIVLQEFEPPLVPVHVLWQNKRPPAKVRAFADLLASRLELKSL